MVKKLYLLIATLCFFGIGFGTYFFPTIQIEKQLPGSTKYGFPLNTLNDYFQYISLIKEGQEGHLFFMNHYTEEFIAPALLQPHWHILGMVTKPFSIDPFDAYRFAYIISLTIFLLFVAFVLNKLLKIPEVIGLGLILFITSSNIYFYRFINGQMNITNPETFSNNFQVFRKLVLIPPHHFIGVVLMGCILFWVIKSKPTIVSWTITALMALILIFTHPYISTVVIVILSGLTVWSCIFSRRNVSSFLIHTIMVILFSVPVLYYYRYVLETVYHGKSTGSAASVSWS